MKQKITTLILVLFIVMPLLAERIDYNNGYYIGDITYTNGKKIEHGKGTFYWNDGDKYEGEWVKGERTGKGIFYFSKDNKNGAVKYEGDFVAGTKHGIGTFYWNNGNKYEGEFKDGYRHGKGTYYCADGSKYEGESKDDNFHGKGTIYLTDGSKYYGELVNGKLDGFYIIRNTRGEYTIGKYENGNDIDSVNYIPANYFFECPFEIPFSLFAKSYVTQKINDWQLKGEFEKTVDYQKRVTEQTRNAKIQYFAKEAENLFVKERTKNRKHNFEIEQYDADNETYLIKCDNKDILVPVQISEAKRFKEYFGSITKKPEYFIDNDTIAISKITFDMYGTKFLYSNQASLNYSIAQIDYNFDPIEIETSGTQTAKGSQNITQTKINVGKADVDMNIPQTNTVNNNTFAFIIANEDYKYEAAVPFAKNDGETFAEYCQKTLGLPEKHVRLFTNATLNDINKAVSDMKTLATAYNGKLNVIFYYAGHGIPDEASKDGYLLPVDGYGTSVATGFSINRLYKELGNLNAEKTVVFLDACFSGSKRDNSMLAQNRGVKIVTKSGVTLGNTVAFTAATGNETAHQYNEKQHGMFTYFLLKKLQETRGDITLGELFNYVSTSVKRTSAVEGTPQNPDKIPAANVGDLWEKWKLK